MIKKLYENLKVKLGRNSIDSSALIGIVSDYIIDSGENENGSWEKWNSGKLVQWGSIIVGTVNSDVVLGARFRTSGVESLTFPISFADGEYYANLSSTRYADVGFYQSGKSLTELNFYITTPTVDRRAFEFSYIAVGRWK